jgi:Lar family restriction alleviation protein
MTKKPEKTVSIKPCPFCNNDNTKEYAMQEFKGIFQVVCAKCGTFGPVGDTDDGALDAWNRRYVSVVSTKTYNKVIKKIEEKQNGREEDNSN